MSAEIINGRTLAKRIREKMRERVAKLPSQPGLAVILVGSDPASHTYVALKERAAAEVGIHSETFPYFATVKDDELIEKIKELNQREDIHAILVQLPLPNHDEDRIIAAIDPAKDVDGFHPKNLEKTRAGNISMISPVALGVLKLIDASERPITGLNAVLVCSQLFAEPIQILLEERGVKSQVISPDDPNLAEKTKNADIIVVAVGRPGLITGEMVAPGAIVIDVGTTRVEEKLKGDVDRESVEPIAGWLTPVPGGVGPMTVAMLMVGVVRTYEISKR